MEIRGFKFDRVEFAGSLGDLGVLLPLAVGLIAINGLNATVVLTAVGLLYIATGLYYRLPIPVQPLKVVAAVTIAAAAGGVKITPEIMAATGISFGVLLLIMAWTGLLGWVEKLFTKAVIRGIQVGLGLMLVIGGIKQIADPALFQAAVGGGKLALYGVPLNIVIGVVAAAIALFLLKSQKFPAALVIVVAGIVAGILLSPSNDVSLALGPMPVKPVIPHLMDYRNALILLVLPQLPLSLGNAIIGMSDTACALFGTNDLTKKSTSRSFATSMGITNVIVGFFAGMPMCHGAGGLAAHYRFGARTGGSNLMIGAIFVILGVLFGKMSLSFLTILPNGVLGALLLFAGLELTATIKDITDIKDFFIVFLIIGIALATTNMAIAFLVGILVEILIKRGLVRI